MSAISAYAWNAEERHRIVRTPERPVDSVRIEHRLDKTAKLKLGRR